MRPRLEQAWHDWFYALEKPPVSRVNRNAEQLCRVVGNWRITFSFAGKHAIGVDYEYHHQSMDTVSFLTVETTDKDLILSFAVMDPNEATDIDSLILMRTPVYEPFFEDWERGVRVSFERHDPEEDDFLDEVQWDTDTGSIRLKTRLHTYRLDLRKVDGKSLSAMRKILKKMNFDGRIQLSGV